MKKRVCLFILLIAGRLCVAAPLHVAAMQPSYPMCNTLTVSLSTDKNYYIFTAASTLAANSNVVGYRFDFGDKQTYSFAFSSMDTQDRARATVQHVYEQNGTYLASAYVLNDTHASPARSAGCTVTVRVGSDTPLPASLVNTGSGNAGIIFAVSTGLGTLSALGARVWQLRVVLKKGGSIS